MSAKENKRRLTIAGIFSLIVVLAIRPEIGGFYVFVAAVTAALMWVLGFGRVPPATRRLRRQAALEPQGRPVPRPEVAIRVFRYPAKRWALILIWSMAAMQGLLAACILLAVPSHPRDAIPLLYVPAIGAGLLGWIAWRTPSMSVTVSPDGIESRQLLGTVAMTWDQIVSVVRVNYYMDGEEMAPQFHIYSADDVITVDSRLLGCADLLDLVYQHGALRHEFA